MTVLWEKGPSTVGEVTDSLAGKYRLAYSSVLTFLRILERKKYVRHTKDGRAFVYHPVVDRDEARRGAVRHLLSRFFDGSPGLLVLNVLEVEKIDAGELKRLKKLIEESE